MSVWSLDTVELPSTSDDVMTSSSSTPIREMEENDGPCDSTTSWRQVRLFQWLNLPLPEMVAPENEIPMGDEFPDQSDWVQRNVDPYELREQR